MEGRSAWTGKRGENLVVVRLPVTDRLGRPAGEKDFLVEPKHEAELRRYLAFAYEKGRRFLGLVFALAAVSLTASFLLPVWEGAIWLVRGALFGLGLTALAYPFATPETNAMLGFQKARALARGGGWLLLAMAIVTLFTGP